MILKRILDFFSSLKLTVVCLGFAIILVFIGTLAQVNIDSHTAQETYFNTFFVYWKSTNENWKIPIFPGGYILGSVLLLNLMIAHTYRFTLSWDKSGIFLAHLGVFLLLVGGFLSSMFTVESQMQLDVGETKNYSEDLRLTELVLVDTSHPDYDEVVAIPEHVLAHNSIIQHPHLPFRLDIKKFYPNSKLTPQKADIETPPLSAIQSIDQNLEVTEQPRATQINAADITTAFVEIVAVEKPLGTWLVSTAFNQPQSFTYQSKTWQIELRPVRYYKPFSIQLLAFTHDQYAGTDIPKNFSSRIHLIHPYRNENREVSISMNHPLRYNGETYYQASFANHDHTSILQVMRNPSWLTPYFACFLVGLGLLVQFSMRLISFVKQQKI